MSQEKLILNLINLLEGEQAKFTDAVTIAVKAGTDNLNHEIEGLISEQSKLLAEINAAMAQMQKQKTTLKAWAKVIGITALVSMIVLTCGIYGIKSVVHISDYQAQNDKLKIENKDLQLKNDQSQAKLEGVITKLNNLPCALKVSLSYQWSNKVVKCSKVKFGLQDN